MKPTYQRVLHVLGTINPDKYGRYWDATCEETSRSWVLETYYSVEPHRTVRIRIRFNKQRPMAHFRLECPGYTDYMRTSGHRRRLEAAITEAVVAISETTEVTT